MERANQQVQQSGQKVDASMLQQQVLDGLISESLFKQELEDRDLRTPSFRRVADGCPHRENRLSP